MRKTLAAILFLVILLFCISDSLAKDDSSESYWTVKISVKNNTEEAIHNLQLGICFVDKDGNILETAFPYSSVRVKAGKTIIIETPINKAANLYALYVDQIEYYDSNEEHKQTYLDILTPVIENDNVTVYGTHNGNKTYTSTWNQAITIPWVQAERIIVK